MSPVASVRGVRDVTRRRKSKIIVECYCYLIIIIAGKADLRCSISSFFGVSNC